MEIVPRRTNQRVVATTTTTSRSQSALIDEDAGALIVVAPPPKTEARVVGYFQGSNPIGGSDFYVLSGDTDIKCFTLPYARSGKPGSLPYEQPSVMYDLTLSLPSTDSFARVTRVWACKPRKSILQRTELIRRLKRVMQAPPGNKDRSQLLEDECMRALPEVITSSTQYSVQHFVKQQWLSARVGDMVQAALLDTTHTFFYLLRYFPGDWLLKFTESQLEGMCCLLRYQPATFLFWEWGVRMLLQMTVASNSATPLFGATTRRELHLCSKRFHRWIQFKNNQLQLLSVAGSALRFDEAMPALSLGKVTYVLEDANLPTGCELNALDPRVLHQALVLYLVGEIQFVRRRSTALVINSRFYNTDAYRGIFQFKVPYSPHGELGKFLDKQLLEPASAFLCQGAMQRCDGYTHGLMRVDRRLDELRLLRAMASRVKRVKIILHAMYDSHFASRLCKEVLNEHCVLITANDSYKMWLSGLLEGTGYKVHAVDTVLQEIEAATTDSMHDDITNRLKSLQEEVSPIPETNAPLQRLVIDRVHKFTAAQLSAIIESTPETAGIELVMIGDGIEYGCSAARGGGAILNSMCMAMRDAVEEWPVVVDAPMMSENEKRLATLYHELQSGALSNLKLVYHSGSKDSWHQINKQRAEAQKTLAKEGKHPNTVQVFCTSDYDRSLTLDKLFRVTPITNSYSFSTKTHVHLLPTDTWGTLDHAAQCSDGYRGVWQQGKKMDLRHAAYQVKVNGKLYDTRHHTLEHADVALLSEYTGGPVGQGFVFLNNVKSCSSLDIFGILKYCIHGVRFYVDTPHGVQELLRKESTPLYTDLHELLIMSIHQAEQEEVQENMIE